MSVNLNLSFEIHNISHIHTDAAMLGEEPGSKRDEIFAAAKKFLDDEGILGQDMIVDFLGKTGYLCGYTTFPIIISRSYEWVPAVTKRWEEMAYRILGPTCEPKLVVDYPDED